MSYSLHTTKHWKVSMFAQQSSLFPTALCKGVTCHLGGGAWVYLGQFSGCFLKGELQESFGVSYQEGEINGFASGSCYFFPCYRSTALLGRRQQLFNTLPTTSRSVAFQPQTSFLPAFPEENVCEGLLRGLSHEGPATRPLHLYYENQLLYARFAIKLDLYCFPYWCQIL